MFHKLPYFSDEGKTLNTDDAPLKMLARQNGSIAYHDAGRGCPIICLHGWGANGAYFAPQFRDLSLTHRVIAPDFRGHGASMPFEESDPFTVLADDVAAIIESENLDEAMIIGWSMGAMVAWDLVSRLRPAGISALVSIDMVPRLRAATDWDFGLSGTTEGPDFDELLDWMRKDWFVHTGVFVPRIVARERVGDFASQIDQWRALSAANHPASMAALWRALLDMDLRHALSGITIPTLITYGAQSQLYRPQASAWIAEQIPNARCHAFNESGHAPHLEEPERFNQIVAEFSNSIRICHPAADFGQRIH